MADSEAIEEYQAVTIIKTTLIGLMSIVGFMCNFLSFLILIRNKTSRNSYVYMAAYEILSNACLLSLFFLWAMPFTLFNVPATLQRLNLLVGQTSLLFQESTVHSSLLIAINRFVAVTYPANYRHIFTGRRTTLLLFIIAICSFLYSSVYLLDACNFYFDHARSRWTFGNEVCSQELAFYVGMGYNGFIFVVISCIDIAVFLRLRVIAKSLLSSSIYLATLVSFNLVTPLANGGFDAFLSSTVIPIIGHSTGGLVLVFFNPDIRRHLARVRGCLKISKDVSGIAPERHQIFHISNKQRTSNISTIGYFG